MNLARLCHVSFSLALLAATHQPFATAASREAETTLLTNATIQKINDLADQMTAVLNRQTSLMEGRDPKVMMDTYVAQEVSRLIGESEAILGKVPLSGEQLSADVSVHAYLDAILKENEGRRPNYEMQYESKGLTALVTFVVAMFTGFSLTEHGGGPNPSTSYIVGQYLAMIGVFGGISILPLGLAIKNFCERRQQKNNTKEKISEKVFERLRPAVKEIFFNRLAANGIRVPRESVMEWFGRVVDGGVMAPWETLTSKEKVNHARQYVEFLRDLAAVVTVKSSELGDQLKALANSITEKTEAVRWFRLGSVRAVHKAMLKTTQILVDLDRTHGILGDAQRESSFAWRSRMVIDYPELFTGGAAEFIRDSLLQFPEEFPAFARKLVELEAKIDVKTQSEKNAAGITEIKYLFSIRIPGQQDIYIDVKIPDKEFSGTGAGREYILARKESLEFERQFRDQLAGIRFGEVLQMHYGERFPERECPYAMINTTTRLMEAVSAAP